MARSQLEIGQRVVVEAPVNGTAVRINACFVKATDSGFYLAPDSIDPGSLPVEQAVTVQYWDERGLYQFEGKVLELTDKPLIAVSRPREVAAVQRRKFFRYPAETAIRYHVIDTRGSKLRGLRRDGDGFTKEISGGGLQFETKLPLSRNDLLRVTVQLGELAPVATSARIVWVTPLEGVTPARYVAGCEFVNIGEYARDRIIRFLFDAQIRAKNEPPKPAPDEEPQR